MIDIKDLFSDSELTETSNGGYKTACPECGLQGGRTEGFIIFPEGNRAFCHSSGNSFNLIETFALKNKILRCLDGREKGQKGLILEGTLFTETLELLREEFDEEIYDEILQNIGMKKSIELPTNGKLMSTFANELVDVLKKNYTMFYRSETREVVEIGKIRCPDKEDKYNGFITMCPNRFITLSENYFKPWMVIYTKQGKINIDKSMNKTQANTVIVSDNFQDKLPVINRIFTYQQPVLYEGELTFPKVGYDKRFGSWLSKDCPRIDEPKMNIEEAKSILHFIFNEFHFQTEQDGVNAVAGFLTPFLRGLYSSFNVRTPIFIYEANRERAGKDFCANLSGILYEGMKIEEPPISNTDKHSNSSDELRKKLLSALIHGRKRLHFANNKGKLDNATFEAVTTNTKFSDRMLGKNKIIEFDNEIEFSLSGNLGIKLTPDLANRSRFVKLFLEVEDANTLKYKNPDLHGWVLKNRGKVLSALYALVRNWIEKGRPEGKLPFTSFPEWANICGGIMETAELGTPCVSDKSMLGIAIDQETDDMKQLFEICYENHPEEFIDKQIIKELVMEAQEIFSEIDWFKKSDQIKFGKMLNRFIGRYLSDIRMLVQDEKIKTQRWKYKFTRVIAQERKKNVVSAIFGQKDGHVGHVGHVCPTVDSHYIEGRTESKKNMPSMPNMTTPLLKIDTTNLKSKRRKKVKKKTNRELQYDEDPQCADIVPSHTKKEVHEWIIKNPIYTTKQLLDEFGVGAHKFHNELVEEGNIKWPL